MKRISIFAASRLVSLKDADSFSSAPGGNSKIPLALPRSCNRKYTSTALAGRAVENFWEGERSFDVVLRFPDSARDSLERISALRIPTRGGALIPLGEVTDIRVGVKEGYDIERMMQTAGMSQPTPLLETPAPVEEIAISDAGSVHD